MAGLDLHRRMLLAAPAALAAMSSPLGALAQAAKGPPPAQAAAAKLAALEPYCGVYRRTDDHAVGIDRFIDDAGEAVLLYADYRSNVVRRAFPRPDGSYGLGPSFDAAEPLVMSLGFRKGARGEVEALDGRSADGSVWTAARAPAREEPVSFRQGDANLRGTLILPEGPGPHPAIVLLHGSGPLTRYSFGPYPRFFSSLGLAVLVYDKRGTGASSGRRLDASTGRPQALWPANYPDDLMADALAAHRLLKSRPEIDARRIGFWGSSEGGMLSTQAAAASPEAAFAINSSGFVGPLWRTILYQAAAITRASGARPSEVAEAVAFNRFWMDVARTGQGYPEFVARREALIRRGKAGWMIYEDAGFSSLEQMRWTWRHILSFDSAPALRRVRCPVLGVFGAADVATDAAVAAATLQREVAAGGNLDVTTRIFPHASHSLMDTQASGMMAPGVFDTLRDWLRPRIA